MAEAFGTCLENAASRTYRTRVSVVGAAVEGKDAAFFASPQVLGKFSQSVLTGFKPLGTPRGEVIPWKKSVYSSVHVSFAGVKVCCIFVACSRMTESPIRTI